MDERYTLTVSQIKDVGILSNGEDKDSKNLFSLLGKVLKLVENRSVSNGVLLATANLEVFDDLISGKYQLPLGKALQLVLVELYKALLLPCAETGSPGAPGYVVRNVITNAMSTMSNSKAPSYAREVTVAIVGETLLIKSMDCGNMLSEIIAATMKMARGTDTLQRVLALRTTTQIVIGGGGNIGDTHAEIVKQASRVVLDKHPDVRFAVASLLSAIAGTSEGMSTVSTEAMLAACVKGLEDDIGTVQDAFASTVGKVYYEQILAHREVQALARAGKNRGGANEDANNTGSGGKSNGVKAPPVSSRMSRLGLSSMLGTAAKKISEEYDFKSVIEGIMKMIVKSQTPNGNLRAGYMAVLGYLLRDCMQSSQGGLTPEDLEWLVSKLLILVHSSEELGIPSYEDLAFFRIRLSHLFRFALTAQSSESGQKTLAIALLQFTSGTVESRSECEIQLALSELAHIILLMGDTAAGVQDDVQAAVGAFLKDNSFGVRSAAAQVLTSLASVIPAVAAGILRKSLAIAKIQVQELVSFAADSQLSQAERMQRMFTFHGHTLVISSFLKAEEVFPTGLPSPLMTAVFDFGLDLLSVDVLSAPMNTRNITCSLVRAGSLIVSSSLHKGYKLTKTRIADLVEIYNMIFTNILAVYSGTGGTGGQLDGSNNPFDAQESAASSPGPASRGQDETLYEMMYMEAALVCLSSLLWSCPDALLYEENCLALVTDGLENAYRISKGKYQPKFKSHFRFKTLHAILLECFSWLPPGSFPNVSQSVYMEALRVLRDCIASGNECRIIGQFSGDTDTQHILGLGNNGQSIHSLAGAASMSSYMMGTGSTVAGGKAVAGTAASASAAGTYLPTYPQNEIILMLKLEQYSVVLSKKENEASLAVFSRDMAMPLQSDLFGVANSIYSTRLDWQPPQAPCVGLDGRIIDAAITLLAATFPHQSTELQDKAVQLSAQAIDQFVKQVSTSTLSMFSSDEEKRKRDKKALVTVKTVVCTLASIVRAFPVHHGMTLELDLPWGQPLLNILTDMLSHYNAEVQYAAAYSMATFSAKITGSHIAQSLCTSLSQEISLAMSKTSAIQDMNSYCGHMLCLSALFDVAEQAEKQRQQRYNHSSRKPAVTSEDSDDDDREDDVRLQVMATVLDCLRKTDTSLTFRSYALFAFGSIFRGCVEYVTSTSSSSSIVRKTKANMKKNQQQSMTLLEGLSATEEKEEANSAVDHPELISFVEKAWQIIEAHFGAVQSWEESDLILTAIQRLVNATVPITLEHFSSKALINHFFVVWKCIKNSTKHVTLHRESAKFLSVIGSSRKLKSNVEHVSKVVSLVKNVYLSVNIGASGNGGAGDSLSRDAYTLRKIVPLLQFLISQCPHLLVDQHVDVLLFQSLDWCCANTALPLRSTYSGVEMRTAYFLKRIDSVSSDMYYLRHELADCIRALAISYCTQNNNKYLDVRLLRYILFCRAVAMGLKESSSTQNADTEVEGSESLESEANTSTKSSYTTGYVASLSISRFCSLCRDIAAIRASSLSLPRIFAKRVAVDINTDLLILLLDMQQRQTYQISVEHDVMSFKERSGHLLAHSDVEVARSMTKIALSTAANTAAANVTTSSSATTSSALTSTSVFTSTENEDNDNKNTEHLLKIYSNVPCYASLFIHDLVNMSCACATFTLDDKLCLSLQLASMQLIYAVVLMFCCGKDPDDISGKEGIERILVLSQFSSQLISAIRPCLLMAPIQSYKDLLHDVSRRRGSGNVALQGQVMDLMNDDHYLYPHDRNVIVPLEHGTYCPPLIQIAGEIIYILLKNAIITDTVAVKRLARLLLTFVQPPTEEEMSDQEENDFPARNPQRYLPLAALQSELTDRLSIRGHISIACNIARIAVLSTISSSSSSSSSSAAAGGVGGRVVCSDSDMCPSTVRVLLTNILLEPNIPSGCVAAQASKNIPTNIDVVKNVWRAILVDGARLLQKSDAEGLYDFGFEGKNSSSSSSGIDDDKIAVMSCLPSKGQYICSRRQLGTSSFSSGFSRNALCTPHPAPSKIGTSNTQSILAGPRAIVTGMTAEKYLSPKMYGVGGSGNCPPGSHVADAWPTDQAISDARRGGATYGQVLDPHSLRHVYNEALPLCLHAYCMTAYKRTTSSSTSKSKDKNNKKSDVDDKSIPFVYNGEDDCIFAIALCMLEQEVYKMPDSPAVASILAALGAMAHAGVGLGHEHGHALSTKNVDASAKVEVECDGVEQWARLLRFIETQLLPCLLQKVVVPTGTAAVEGGPLGHLQLIAALLEALPFRAGKADVAEEQTVDVIPPAVVEEGENSKVKVDATTKTDMEVASETKDISDTITVAATAAITNTDTYPSGNNSTSDIASSDDPWAGAGLTVHTVPLPSLSMASTLDMEKCKSKYEDTNVDRDEHATSSGSDSADGSTADATNTSTRSAIETGSLLRDPLWTCTMLLLFALRPDLTPSQTDPPSFSPPSPIAASWDPSGSLSIRICSLLCTIATVEVHGQQLTRPKFILLAMSGFPPMATNAGWLDYLQSSLLKLVSIFPSPSSLLSSTSSSKPNTNVGSNSASVSASTHTTNYRHDLCILLLDMAVLQAEQKQEQEQEQRTFNVTLIADDKKENPNSAVEACIDTWVQIAADTSTAYIGEEGVSEFGRIPPPPVALGSLITKAITTTPYQTKNKNKDNDLTMATSIVAFALRYCKTHITTTTTTVATVNSSEEIHVEVSKSILTALYPAMLHTISGDTNTTGSSSNSSSSSSSSESSVSRLKLELVTLQLLFLSLSVATNAIVAALTLIIPAVCSLLSRCTPTATASNEENEHNNSHSTVRIALYKLASQGLVHIARTHVDAFRAVVATLPENTKTTLQNAMREALAAQQHSAAAQSAAGGSSLQPMGLKIDMAKFKK